MDIKYPKKIAVVENFPRTLYIQCAKNKKMKDYKRGCTSIVFLQSNVVQLGGVVVTESFLSSWTPTKPKKSEAPLFTGVLSKSSDG